MHSLYLLMHTLSMHGTLELVTRIKSVKTKEKCPENNYDLGDDVTSVYQITTYLRYTNWFGPWDSFGLSQDIFPRIHTVQQPQQEIITKNLD